MPIYMCLSVKYVKGENWSKHSKELVLGQNKVLVMVNKCVKFYEISFSSTEITAMIKFVHDDNHKGKHIGSQGSR